jgi:tetratricopeptide (TPR) repeat protein
MWLGVLLLETHRLEEADGELRRALALREAVIADGPASPGLTADLEHVKGKLGDLTLRMGRFDEAERFFREAIALREPLSRDFPGTVEHRRRLGSQYRGLGQALWAMGRLRPAEQVFRVALAIREKLADEHPDNPVLRENLAAIHGYLGYLLQEDRRGDEAEEEFRKSLGIYEQLVAQVPHSTGPRGELAWLLADCPALQLRDEARAMTMAQRVLQTDPASGFAWCVLGAASYRRGDWPAAVEALTKAVKLGPRDCASLLYLAMVHHRLGTGEQARACYEKARAMVTECWPEYPGLGRLRTEAAELLQIQDKNPSETKGRR